MVHIKHFDLARFSDPSLLILASLAGCPRHGYAMMEDIFQFCGTKLEPGTLYAALARLERRGWIEALEAEDRRRPYLPGGRDAVWTTGRSHCANNSRHCIRSSPLVNIDWLQA